MSGRLSRPGFAPLAVVVIACVLAPIFVRSEAHAARAVASETGQAQTPVPIDAPPQRPAPAVVANAIFRVFLTDGRAMPAFGEAAITADRVVFTLLVSAGPEAPVLQLVNLPAAAVDVARTRRYAESIRAAHYARTRGDIDYAAMTQEVQRAVTELTAIADPRRRLEVARAARARLLAWADMTYGFRGAEIAELAALFDDVIAELAVAAGEPKIAVDFRGGAKQDPEPLLAAPSADAAIDLALAAAAASDSEDERMAILRAASAAAERLPSDAPARLRARRELDAESTAATAYASLAADVRERGADARRRGDLAALERLVASLPSRDADLGRRRPQIVDALVREVEAMARDVRTHAAALDRYHRVRGSLLAYERAIRPVMSGLDGLRPVLLAIKELRHTAYERLVTAGQRLARFSDALAAVTPPDDLADVHATLVSALHMASRACERRRLAVSLVREAIAEEASTSAAGALLLADEMREQLVRRLYPPKIQDAQVPAGETARGK